MEKEKKFHEMNLEERFQSISKKTSIPYDDLLCINNPSSKMKFDDFNRMIENAIGFFPIPVGVATNFIINEKNYMIPMAIEEPSVIAAASYAAKLAGINGGFKASMKKSVVRGQIQLISLENIKKAIRSIRKNKKLLINIGNSKSRRIKIFDIKTRIINDDSKIFKKKMLLVELFVDVKDVMGANAVNSMCELLAPHIEKITHGKSVLKILSNYSVERLAVSQAVFRKEDLGGEEIIDRMLYAFSFAYSDPYRAVTHNKGIMNGIDAIAIATGQDFRAIEAASHAYASRTGKYRSLTYFSKLENGDLKVKIELPMAVGIVGGVSSVHPIAQICLRILGVKSATELGMIIATVGLAQNVAAIRALSAEGIQKGHMRLHAKNIAAAVGARQDLIDIVAKKMYDQSNINIENAKIILEELKAK